MKIALAQINPTIGALDANGRKIVEFAGRAASAGAELVVFPEMAVLGYPPRDLLHYDSFVDHSFEALDRAASQITNIKAVVGCIDRNPASGERPLFNAAAFIDGGRIVSMHHKSLLPTYDVFDEDRYFQPAAQSSLAGSGGAPLGISICEDAWNSSDFWPRRRYDIDPIENLVALGAKVLINISASPYVLGKRDFRFEMLAQHSRNHGLPLMYVNQVGGNDELIFDGNSAVIRPDGHLAGVAKQFEEDLLVVDLDDLPARDDHDITDEDISTVHDALVLGTRDYIAKCKFSGAIVALSGGIDSTVVACIAAAAVGPQNVLGVSMPSRYSSGHSVTDAEKLAGNLGIRYLSIPIGEVHDAFESSLAEAFTSLEPGLAEENIQARARGTIAMALSNKFGMLVLTTGNKSEVSVGYCTLYGDMCGGLAVIGDLPKMTVYELARYINRDAQVIPESCITKPPSAELRPGQADQDSLPPYDLLDSILKEYVENTKSARQIIDMGFDEATVREMIAKVDRSEYKRRQMAPALKVTSRAFGTGRRMPIARGYD